MVLQKRWITDDQTKWRQYYNGISQTVSDQPASSLANHTRWYPSSPLDDLSGADLLVVGPKAVVIPSYMPRLSATISTQLDAFIQFQPAFIYTVSRCSLNNAGQWWISTSVTYHRGRNDLIDDFESCLVLWSRSKQLKLKLFLPQHSSETSKKQLSNVDLAIRDIIDLNFSKQGFFPKALWGDLHRLQGSLLLVKRNNR